MRPSSSSFDSSNDDCDLKKTRKRGAKAHRSADIERRRNLDINAALEKLQSIIPVVKSQEKLSKIKRLRIAIRYIEYLARILNSDENSNSPSHQGFQSIVMHELQTRNSYVERAEEERGHEDLLYDYASPSLPPQPPIAEAASPPIPPMSFFLRPERVTNGNDPFADYGFVDNFNQIPNCFFSNQGYPSQ